MGKTALQFNRSIKLFHRIDDETITIDSTFNGNTEESVVVSVLAAGTFKRGTGGTATGKGSQRDGGSCDDKQFFHKNLLVFF